MNLCRQMDSTMFYSNDYHYCITLTMVYFWLPRWRIDSVCDCYSHSRVWTKVCMISKHLFLTLNIFMYYSEIKKTKEGKKFGISRALYVGSVEKLVFKKMKNIIVIKSTYVIEGYNRCAYQICHTSLRYAAQIALHRI